LDIIRSIIYVYYIIYDIPSCNIVNGFIFKTKEELAQLSQHLEAIKPSIPTISHNEPPPSTYSTYQPSNVQTTAPQPKPTFQMRSSGDTAIASHQTAQESPTLQRKEPISSDQSNNVSTTTNIQSQSNISTNNDAHLQNKEPARPITAPQPAIPQNVLPATTTSTPIAPSPQQQQQQQYQQPQIQQQGYAPVTFATPSASVAQSPQVQSSTSPQAAPAMKQPVTMSFGGHSPSAGGPKRAPRRKVLNLQQSSSLSDSNNHEAETQPSNEETSHTQGII
jgi:hypothetical protein